MAFATMADLAAAVHADEEDAVLLTDTRYAQRQLEVATDIIRAYTGQTISAGTTTETLYPVRRVAMLSERPVTAVTTVSVDGAVWPSNDWWWTIQGHVWRLGGHWGAPLEVEYDHGFDPIPGDLVRVCASLAYTLVEGKAGVRSESLGSASVTYLRSASGDEVAVSADQQMVLDRYKPVVAP